jgi:glycosyltransferase involved in cell wall biosynthesis
MNPGTHFLHISPSFAPGGAQVRTAQLVNYFGSNIRHTVVSLDGDVSAKVRINSNIDVNYLEFDAGWNPAATINRFTKLIRRLRPDLLLTYNWGSIEAVAAAALLSSCPAIHTEDGFSDDEAFAQKRRRVWMRRGVLRGAFKVVAPSLTLVRIMRDVWRVPPRLIEHIPNGIDLERFSPTVKNGHSGPLVIGTVGHLRKEKRQDVLIDAYADLAQKHNVSLVIAGEGPERQSLEERVRARRVQDRVSLLGHIENVGEIYRQVDVFALTSDTEQMPLSVLEAMACGLPVVSTDVGDIRNMLSRENSSFLGRSTDDIRDALDRLVSDAALRKAVGDANRVQCHAQNDLDVMFRRYADLYDQAIASHTK